MITTSSVQDTFLGRTAAVEYDNAIQFAGYLHDTGDTKKDILPGYVMKNVGGKNLELFDGTGIPFGLASVFRAPGYGHSGINQVGANGEFTAIVGTSNTTVRVQKAALATDASFVVPTDGTSASVNANSDGKLTSKTGPVVGRLLEVSEDGSIVIQLYSPALTPAA